MSRGRTGDMRGQVLAYLQREADMDGLATVSQQEIGSRLGVSQAFVSFHLRRLCDDGVIGASGRVTGVKQHAIIAYQLTDEAMA